MKQKPIEDQVLVQPDAAEEKTQSGIFIPNASKTQPKRGTVILVGDGKDGIPMQVAVGDRVAYGDNAGVPLNLDGVNYLIMRQPSILIRL